MIAVPQICEQTVKPRARYFDESSRRRLAIPSTCCWYVEAGLAAGWGETLEEAWLRWRTVRIALQSYKFMEADYEAEINCGRSGSGNIGR